MAIQDFVECYAFHVGTTVDAVSNDINAIGTENIKRFITWFRGLSDADRALLLAVANYLFAGVLLKILEKVIGRVAAAAIIALLGGASWALLAQSFLACKDRL